MISQTEYMNPDRFPLTSQKGLDYQSQKMIDSFNYDQGAEGIELKESFNDRQRAISKELSEKLGLPDLLENY